MKSAKPSNLRALPAAKAPHGSFLYSDVARELRHRISQKLYLPGSKLPSMGDLTAEFGVSAITVRNALRELSHEGLISGHQGLGVFVREKAPIHRVLAGNPQSSIGDAIARAGHQVRIEEISYEEIQADADLAGELKVRRNARLFRHRKITFADDQPIALHITVFTPAIAKRLRQHLGKEFIWPLLARHGIDIDDLRCEFAAVAASDEQAQYFGLRPGFPLLRVHYTPVDADGVPIFSGITIARSDRFVFEVNLPQRPPESR
jgi:DNA-binding GntR family transcriptional regulator